MSDSGTCSISNEDAQMDCEIVLEMAAVNAGRKSVLESTGIPKKCSLEYKGEGAW